MGYEAGKIYIIKCGECFYYGSCITSIARRATTHRYRIKTRTNKLYEYIKDKEWTIELVCEAPCNKKLELLQKEDEYVRPNLSNPLCLNERSATWDKEKDRLRKKVWYNENRERLLQKVKEKYSKSKSMGTTEAKMLHQ